MHRSEVGDARGTDRISSAGIRRDIAFPAHGSDHGTTHQNVIVAQPSPVSRTALEFECEFNCEFK